MALGPSAARRTLARMDSTRTGEPCPAAEGKRNDDTLHPCKHERGHTGDYAMGDGTHECHCGFKWVQMTTLNGVPWTPPGPIQ